MSPRVPSTPLPLPALRVVGAMLSALVLAGCPYLGEEGYTDKVRDVDGDGFIAERFGGTDCDDSNPDIGDCDADQDGFRSVAGGGGDCDDTDARIHPDAPEVCDGADNDCDGLVDNDDEVASGPTVWRDVDGDGWGSDEGMVWCGDAPDGYAAPTRMGDCDDDDGDTFPGAQEDCGPVDRNCDGDPTLGAADGTNWYADLDSDGHGAGAVLAKACERPADLVDSNDDCAPSNPDVHPSADDVPYDGIDQDCSGSDLTDVDGDGEAAIVAGGVDCNDADIAIHTGAEEICDGLDNDCNSIVDDGLLVTSYLDADSDGFGDLLAGAQLTCGATPAGRVTNAADCDDGNPNVNPSVAEACDGVDNDCNGEVDGPSSTDAVSRWADADGDLYGDPNRTVTACLGDFPLDVPWVDNSLDCDDAHITAHEGGEEVCDGLDNDCNGLIDDGDDRRIYFVDSDEDGFGDPSQPIQACVREDGLTLLTGDCDDSDPDSYPGAPEVCGDAFRQDCSDADPDDCDGDGVVAGPDCDDTNPDVGPFAAEICDGIDNDCDGDLDDADADIVLATRADWYEDLDGDGIGSTNILAPDTCTPPAGTVRFTGDCDDTRADRTPGAVETCDGIDNDCDGLVDENVSDGTVWYADADGDGFGEQGSAPIATQCDPPAVPAADNALDCDDGLALVGPGAEEVCDGIDNDCDGLIDDADPDVTLTLWYLDEDGDGYGDDAETLEACDAPVGYVIDGGDCDDGSPDRAPGSDELCDGLDNDCDGLVDGDDPDETQPSMWFADRDGDGYGDPGDVIEDCNRPNDYVANDDDCDDADALIRPGALETCDGLDNDCDGMHDEAAADATIWFYDEDRDGWGAIDRSTLSCSPPADHTNLSGDCDDEEPTVHPGAPEVCADGFDNDCNGLTDGEDPGASDVLWYPDLDGDGSGASTAAGISGCEPPPNDPYSLSVLWAPNNLDCDDGDGAIGPHAQEVCDAGIDNDCDGLVDSQDDSVDAPRRWVDADLDGYGVGNGAPRCDLEPGWADLRGDCDDAAATVSPGASETCNGTDDDCDGSVDEEVSDGDSWVLDSDGDGFVDLGTLVQACGAPGPSWVMVTGGERSDCDDGNVAVHDDALEICDGVDNDCNGLVDDGIGLEWTVDADGDGYGDAAATPVIACDPPPGTVSNALDCLDQLDPAHPSVDPAEVNPGRLLERCNDVDDDCDGLVDNDAATAEIYYLDGDRDGVAAFDAAVVRSCDPVPGLVQLLGDCNDADPTISPLADERCATTYDDDCNGVANDDDPFVADGTTFYADFDADGHGRASIALTTCTLPAGFAADDRDCDDTTDVVHPGAAEVCDGLDNDCDGLLTAEEDDIDNDGYVTCADYVEHGEGLLPGDCDEGNVDAYPGAPEQCNGADDDCNGIDDDLVSNVDYWIDADGDGFGDASSTPINDCVRPPGYVANDSDCDDTRFSVKPGAAETPGDNVDQNCDSVENCYADGDDDGYRSSTVLVGGTNGDADCDDGGEARSTAPSDCNDADGALTVNEPWYGDCDGDGEPGTAYVFGCGADDGATRFGFCDDSQPPDGGTFPAAGSDCNDEDPFAVAASDFFPDCDGDGVASSDVGDRVRACGTAGADALSPCTDGQAPDGGWHLALGSDCNDENGSVRPGVAEVTGDEIDQNCDTVELCWADADDDGYRSDTVTVATVAGDLTCDETGTAPDAAPIDCSDADPTGQTQAQWFADCDGDGHFASANSTYVCGAQQAILSFTPYCGGAPTPDEVSDVYPVSDDCNDFQPLVNPSATESAGNNLDEDCTDTVLCYVDADNDGFRLSTTFETLLGDLNCTDPFEGRATDALDCDDGDFAVRPGVGEIPGDEIDQNCDTVELCWADADDDGYRSDTVTVATVAGDLTCDETGTATTAALIDCDDTDATGQEYAWWYPDCDNDGYFDGGHQDWACGESSVIAITTVYCGRPMASDDVTIVAPGANSDCVDFDPTVNPGAPEVAGNDVDEDCDARVDCYVDDDDDGARLTTTFTTSLGDYDCQGYQEGRDTDPIDCDDTDYWVFQTEDWYIDCDYDGYVGATYLSSCGAPLAGDFGCGNGSALVTYFAYPPTDTDCDDSDYSVYPYALEYVGDEIDQNCNGREDCYWDADGDGHSSGLPRGEAMNADTDCQDAGEASSSVPPDDCNDSDPSAFEYSDFIPDCDGDGDFAYVSVWACGVTEANAAGLCSDSQPPDGGWGVEWGDDCNDEDASTSTYDYFYPDCDGDGHFPSNAVYACGVAEADLYPMCNDSQPPDGGWSLTPDDDCNDEDAAWYAWQDWYPDCDGDGFFTGFGIGIACTLDDANLYMSGCPAYPLDASDFVHVAPSSPDCADYEPYTYPGAVEVCDGLQNDCDGGGVPADEWDDDYDGYVECGPYVEHGAYRVGGDDCVDDYSAYSWIFYPNQVLDLDSYPGVFTLQEAVDSACDEAIIYPETYATYDGIVLGSGKTVVIDGTGRNATIQDATSPAVLASGTPAGTEIIGVDLWSNNHQAVSMVGGELLLRDVLFAGSGNGDDQGILATSGAKVEVYDSLFDLMTGTSGVAVSANNGSVVHLERVDIMNSVTSEGGPVTVTNGSLTMIDVALENGGVWSSGQFSTAITANDSTTELTRVRAAWGISSDRQPAIVLQGGTAQLTDVSLIENPGGLWLVGTADVTATRLTAALTGGNAVPTNYEGAIDLRDSAKITASNVDIHGTVGPAVHLRDSSSATLSYATLVGNGGAGIVVDPGNLGLELHQSILFDNPADVVIDATYLSAVNSGLRLQGAGSAAQLCALPSNQDCSQETDPEFITWFGTLHPSAWLLRPYVGGPLWNGALAPSNPSFDPTPIIGHAGGPDGAPGWYDDVDGDGMYDGWELHYAEPIGWDLTAFDQGGQWDGDYVDDDSEFLNGTNPTAVDTDGDGADDGYDTAPLDCSIPFSLGCSQG